jgi:hypothetical protein
MVAPGADERAVASAALEIEFGRDIRVRIAAAAPKELACAICPSTSPRAHCACEFASRKTRDNRLVGTKNPEGYERAFWLNGHDLGVVIRKARQDSGDVVKAAAALRIRCVDHANLMQRTESIVDRLGTRLASAQRSGEVSFINREYKRRRQEAFAQGRPFMPYQAVQARLRQALSEVAAGRPPTGIMKRVFES